LEAGFQAERYYEMDYTLSPLLTAKGAKYDASATITVDGGPVGGISLVTLSSTEEIIISWDYLQGAEEYELEWTWIDLYGDVLSVGADMSTIDLDEFTFSHNCTRIRTSHHFYQLPNLFAKGIIIYRVRAVGRWMSDPSKEL